MNSTINVLMGMGIAVLTSSLHAQEAPTGHLSLSPTSIKLTPCAAATNGAFGSAIAAEGGTIAVGDPRDTDGGGGSVCIYEDGESTASATLFPTQNPLDWRFGSQVQLEGDTLIVAGHSVYVYRRLSPGIWIAEDVIPIFPRSISLDRSTLAIGLSSPGVGVYRRPLPDQEFEEIAVIPSPLGVVGFGMSVSLAGRSLLIGAADVAFLYREESGVWQAVDTLETDLVGPLHSFGRTVVLQRGTAYIADPLYGSDTSGAILVYKETQGMGWSLHSKLLPRPGQSMESFGTSLAVRGDEVFVGAPARDARQAALAGAVYRYKQLVSGDWKLVQRVIADDPQLSGAFGTSIAWDAGVVFVGAVGSDLGGAAYCLDL